MSDQADETTGAHSEIGGPRPRPETAPGAEPQPHAEAHRQAGAEEREPTPVSLDEYVRQAYPDLKRGGPPSLFTLNSFGTSMWGHRDENPQDGSYVKTLCIVALFLPVIPLLAYRVLDAQGGGWVFLGKTRLSGFAKAWNAGLLLFVGLFVLIGVTAPSSGQRAMSDAREHEAAARYTRAAQGYVGQLTGAERQDAREALKALISGPLRQASGDEQIATLRVFAQSQAAAPLFDPSQDDAWVSLALSQGEQDAEGGLRLLEALEPLAEKEVQAARVKLLQRLNDQDPTNPVAASGLALIFEEEGKPDDAWRVLAPAREKLGTREGARILGLLLLARNDLAGAVALLDPYVSAKLPEARRAQQALQAAYQRVQSQAEARLDNNGAPQSWYRSYKAASPEGKQKLVNDYMRKAFETSAEIKTAQELLARAGKAIPVALELAIARLTLAQELAGEERQGALQAAEKLLLAVQESAGDSERFKLNMAKVHYWLGRPEQGRALLKELEEAGAKECPTLYEVAGVLRQVGRDNEARQVAEAGYEVGTPQEKLNIASFLAIMAPSREDKIKWLERCDPKQPRIQALLAESRAGEAEGKGDLVAAERHLLSALKSYGEMTEDATLLNNRAGIYQSLWRVSGRHEHLTKFVGDLRRALELNPSHPILLGNFVSALQIEASQATLRALDFAQAKQFPSIGFAYLLAQDQAGLDALIKAYLENKSLQESDALLRKLRLLAPGSYSSASTSLALAALRDDPAELASMEQVVDKVDLSDYTEQVLGSYFGDQAESQERHAGALKTALASAASLEGAGGVNYALALTGLVRTRLGGRGLGLPVDADALLSEVKAAHAAAPSLQTQMLLMSAHAYRALSRLAPEHRALGELAVATQRSLDAPYVLAYALAQGGETATAIKADPDFQALVKQVADLQRRAPKLARLWHHVLLDATGSPQAEALASYFKEDRTARLKLKLLGALSPLDAEQVLEQAWCFQLIGKPDLAQALIAKAKEAGVPLP